MRLNFVSNSSSASFVIEVKGEKENILNSLYENIEDFQEENYKELLKKALEWEQNKLTKELTKTERSVTEYTIEEYTRSLNELEEYKKISWSDLQKIEDPEEKSFAIWKEKNHIEKVVMGVLDLNRWHCGSIDDGYISFADSTSMYNGWENIAIRKTFIEVLAFFVFMKYEVRTRIESDLQ